LQLLVAITTTRYTYLFMLNSLYAFQVCPW